jgi:hypothetical protein
MSNNKEDKNEKPELSILANAKSWRQPLVDNWRFCYELYTARTGGTQDSSGIINNINSGKVFELTETFVSYFIQAVMFRDRFFDASPTSVGSQQYSSIVVELLADYIGASNFTRTLSECLRQLILTGNSGMTVMVRNQKLMFECLDIFRTFLLPGHSFEAPNFIYEYRFSETELYEFYKAHKELKMNFDDFKTLTAYSSNDVDSNQNNINAVSTPMAEFYSLYCRYYWCHLRNDYEQCWFSRSAELFEKLIKPEHVPIVVTAISLPGSPYGISPLENIVSLISEYELLRANRAAAAQVSNWRMFTSSDGMVPDDMEFAPNKVFRTSMADSLVPLQMPTSNYQLTAAESQAMESSIYTTVGLGNGVSANSARQGERVTATEIESLQKASGTRLNLMFATLECELFSPIINYAAKVLQNISGKKQVRVYNLDTDGYDIFDVPHKLLKDFKIVLDVSKVKERIEAVQKLIDFVAATGNIPAAQEVIDYKNIVMDIVALYGFPEPERYIKKVAPATPEQPASDPYTESLQQTGSGIDPSQNRIIKAMQQGVATDPAMAAMAQGGNPNDPGTYQQAESLVQQQAMAQQAAQIQPGSGVFT